MSPRSSTRTPSSTRRSPTWTPTSSTTSGRRTPGVWRRSSRRSARWRARSSGVVPEPDPMTEHAGQVIRRREDPRLLTGAGQFVDDLRLASCLHVALVRSPHASARLGAIATSAAEKAPGVITVVTAVDLGRANSPLPVFAPHPALPTPCGIRALAEERVRFVGEPVAAVVADDPYRAHDAAALVQVAYEPLASVDDVDRAAVVGEASDR